MSLWSIIEPLVTEQGGVISTQQLKSAGIGQGGLRSALRQGMLTPVGRSWYSVTPDGSWTVASTVARLGGAASHQTAAALWRIDLVHPSDVCHVSVSRNRSLQPTITGVRIHRRDRHPDELTRVDGILTTTPLATVLDLTRILPLQEAVAAADSALRLNLLGVAGLESAAHNLRGPGRRRAIEAVTLSDRKAGSVLESLARMLFHVADFPPPVLQYPFHSRDGSFVGYVDFGWPDLRLLVETDGFAYHRRPEDLVRDCRRANAFAREGWKLLRFTWDDVVNAPDSVLRDLRAVACAA